MGKHQHFECVECDAVFKIKFDLDENYYVVTHCPFCGAEIDEDQHEDFDNEDII